MSRRSLVTGGQGFIGGHLVKALIDRGDDVIVLDLPDAPGVALRLHGLESHVEMIEGNVADRIAVDRAMAGVQSVFHLAAQTLVGPAAADPLATFRSNVEGTWTILESARQVESVDAVVVASSDKAYGPSDSLPYREGDELRPAAPYEGSKAAADVIARSYWQSWGLPVGVTRLANVYGGGDLNFSRLVPEVVTAYLGERQPQIRSDGSPQRDFLHVSDAVDAYIAIETAVKDGRARGEALNAGTGEPRSVRQVIDQIQASTGSRQQPDYLLGRNPDGEIDQQYVDASRLTGLTDWEPKTSFEDGINEAVAWYGQHGEIVRGRSDHVRRK